MVAPDPSCQQPMTPTSKRCCDVSFVSQVQVVQVVVVEAGCGHSARVALAAASPHLVVMCMHACAGGGGGCGHQQVQGNGDFRQEVHPGTGGEVGEWLPAVLQSVLYGVYILARVKLLVNAWQAKHCLSSTFMACSSLCSRRYGS